MTLTMPSVLFARNACLLRAERPATATGSNRNQPPRAARIALDHDDEDRASKYFGDLLPPVPSGTPVVVPAHGNRIARLLAGEGVTL